MIFFKFYFFKITFRHYHNSQIDFSVFLISIILIFKSVYFDIFEILGDV